MLTPSWNEAGIPLELRRISHWVVWRYEQRGPKTTKVPYAASTGEQASTTNEQTWTDYREAVAVAARFDGIGFVFSNEDQYFGIDLDRCRNPETGEIAAWAQAIIDAIDSYREITPSGCGIHIIGKGKLPPGRRREGPIEMYDMGRYFTMTGRRLPDCPDPQECGEALGLLHARVFPTEPEPSHPVTRRYNGAAPEDEAVLRMVCRLPAYDALWRGDHSAYDSQSEADLALCGRIAFFVGPDALGVDRVFRQSGLYREKWDDAHHGRQGTTYGQGTVEKALSGKTQFFNWTAPQSRLEAPRREDIVPVALVEGRAEEEWEEPIPLYAVDLPEFPVHALPPYIAAMVTGTAQATQTPPDLAAMVSLAVLATAAQKRAEALIREGWAETLSLWTVTSLAPGNRKTSAYGPMVAPLQDYERHLIERMKDEIAESRTEYEVSEGALKRLKDQAVKAKTAFDREELTRQAVVIAQKLERSAVPKSPRMIADDATPEELGRLLAANGGRMAIISDEGDVFDMMAGRYSSGKANIGVYLRGHTGGDVIVDRVGRPDIVVRRAAITFGLCVQPEALLGLTANPTFKGRGLLGRFLFSVPFSRLGEREIRPVALLHSVAREYTAKLTRLFDLPADQDDEGRPVPHLIPFSAAADDAAAAFERWVEPRLQPGAELAHMSDWAGKIVGQTCRIATLLHLAELADTEKPWRQHVDEHNFAAARAIAEYLIPHAQAAFQAMGSDPQVNRARLILGWLKKHGHTTFQKRDLFNGMRAQFDRATEVDDSLVILLEHGFIRQQPTEKRSGPGQPPSPAFRVHPQVLRPV